jgi:RsiW-degrading membrane proteinase PrsW (M82 family)
MPLYLILAALLPSLILAGHITFKDRKSPEPTRMLVKAFGFGMLSVLVSLCFSLPLQLYGVFSSEPVTVWDHFRVAMFGAAVPEEAAKLLMLWLLLRRNPWFDEHFDGIVYAVCIGMGFAFVENIGYLASAGEYWLHAGITRGLISVPGHYAFAVLMGFYYSYACFGAESRRGLYRVLTFAAPVIAHMLFDWILMVSDSLENQLLSSLLTLLFLIVFIRLQKAGKRRISTHLTNDGI